MQEEQEEAMSSSGNSASFSPLVSANVSSNSKKKHEEKYRKKDPKSWENIVKAVLNMSETEKSTYIEEKYQELYNEYRHASISQQQLSKQCSSLQKERDHNQAELAKSVVARARLENLCRELQKQNKQIKEENSAKIKEEEERRKEVSLRFADKLSDINTMMDENKEKSDKLRDENLKMTAKLAELYDQFQRREEDISKMSHQLELERQLSQANIAKMELEIRAEKEMHAKEQAIMKGNLEKSEANVSLLLDTVKELQENIDMYKHQYEDFESTMSKSTKVFDTFKYEIANMAKQVTILEHEADTWKEKYHNTMKALIDMTESKKNQDLYLHSMDRKNDQLQKLCRQLQVDRANFLKLLKSHGIEPVSSPSADESVKKVENTQVTKKEKELQILKDNLKAVQDELTRLSSAEEANKTDEVVSQIAVGEDNVKNEQLVKENILGSPNPDSISSHKVVFLDNERGMIEEVSLRDDDPPEQSSNGDPN